MSDLEARVAEALNPFIGPIDHGAMARDVAEETARRYGTTVRDFAWTLDGNTLHVDVALDLPPDTPIQITVGGTE